MKLNLYWLPNKLLSYQDCHIFIVCGGRGLGKTYSFKKYFIKDYLKNKKQFLYLRRYESDYKNVDMLFSDIVKNNEFPDHTIKIKSNRVLIKPKRGKKWETMGFLESVSQAKNIKGSNYPDLYNIFYDEFQLDDTNKQANRYIPGEIKYFSDIIESFVRDREAMVVMASNSISKANPYFATFKLDPKPNGFTKQILTTYITNPLTGKKEKRELRIVCEMVDSNTEFMMEKSKSISGLISLFTGMGESSLMNEYLNDSDSFIETKPKDSVFKFNVKINGKIYGAWSGYDDVHGFALYFCKKIQLGSKHSYCVRKEDIEENFIFVKSWRQIPDFESLKNYVRNNRCYFSDQNIKHDCGDIFTLLNIY